MGIRRFFISVLFLAMIPCTVQAQSCSDYKIIPTKISVSPEIPKVDYNNKKTLKEINDAKAQQRHTEWLEKNGLTGVIQPKDMTTQGYHEMGMAAYFLSKLTKLPPNRPGANSCLYFESIDLTMMFRSQIVIPKEFKPGECDYKVIDKHERRHYEAMRESAQEVVRQAQKDLPAILGEIENRKYNVRSFAEKAKAMQAAVHPAVMDYMQKVLGAELMKRNDIIDSPESYDAAGAARRSCNPELYEKRVDTVPLPKEQVAPPVKKEECKKPALRPELQEYSDALDALAGTSAQEESDCKD